MSPFSLAVLAGVATAAVVLVPAVLLLRRHRRAVARTTWPQWRAEARQLPRGARRTVERSVQRGRGVPPELAGCAARYGRAVLEVHQVGRRWQRRRWVRAGYAGAVVLGAVALSLGTVRLVQEGPSLVRLASVLPWFVTLPVLLPVALGRDLAAGRVRRVRHSVELAEAQQSGEVAAGGAQSWKRRALG